MNGAPEWHAEARRLLEAGMVASKIAREIGQSEHAIRKALNINGYNEKMRVNALRKQERITQARQAGVYVRASKSRADRNRVDPALLQPATITLPRLTILDRPDEIAAPVRSFAPKTRWRAEAPRVAEIREIHRRMIRDGRVAAPSIVQEMHP